MKWTLCAIAGLCAVASLRAEEPSGTSSTRDESARELIEEAYIEPADLFEGR